MSDALKQILDVAIRRRDKVSGDVQRVKGRLESAQASLQEVVDECQARNIDPKTLGSKVSRVRTELTASIQTVNEKIAAAEKKLAPFLQEEAE